MINRSHLNNLPVKGAEPQISGVRSIFCATCVVTIVHQCNFECHYCCFIVRAAKIYRIGNSNRDTWEAKNRIYSFPRESRNLWEIQNLDFQPSAIIQFFKAVFSSDWDLMSLIAFIFMNESLRLSYCGFEDGYSRLKLASSLCCWFRWGLNSEFSWIKLSKQKVLFPHKRCHEQLKDPGLLSTKSFLHS